MPLSRARSAACAAVVIGAAGALASNARAADRDVCVDAATEGQTLRDRGELLAARRAFVACAQQSCPSVVSTQCGQWLVDIEHRIPRVVFRVEDAAGMDLSDASISVDGRPPVR